MVSVIETTTQEGTAFDGGRVAARRHRPAFMRTDLVERLTKEGIDGGMLALLGSVG
jgi:hypothetical protein